MLGASINRYIREAARRFVGANQGNIAVIFAIALVPIISFVGAAIDYSRANNARSSMQAALDSTALMLAKDLSTGVITTAQIATKAQAYFTALYTNPDAKSVSVNATYTADNGNMGSTIQVNGSGSITTDFMKVAGFPNMNFNASSTSAWGNVRMRVALALDNTGSMKDNGKIGALRTAASNLVDQLGALAKNPGDVYISVIPFAKIVNAGSNNSGATWIDWTDWQNPPTEQPNNGSYEAALQAPQNPKYSLTQWANVGPGSACPFTSGNGFPYFTCTSNPTNGSSNASTIPTSGTYAGYICPGLDAASHTFYNGCWNSVSPSALTVFCTGSSCSCTGANSTCVCTGNNSNKSCKQSTYTHNWIANSTSTWTGCITDRTQDYDTTGDAPTLNIAATLFPANQHYENSEAYCKPNNSPLLEPIMPMTYDWSTLKTNIKAMQPTGGTNQAIGLAWAWQSLLQIGPVPAPAEDSNYSYNRVIILLSDGLNTEDRWPENGDGVTQNNGAIDTRQALLCKNIKALTDPKTNQPMYTVYTIQVNTSSPADPTSTVLKNCATDTSKFFMLTNANQIVTTFNTIGTSLSQLRVAR
jgi:Flp pilus assembly protein TadG